MTILEKIASRFPSWTSRDGLNGARNKALADAFEALQLQVNTIGPAMSISTAPGEIPFSVGVFTQPKLITGIKFFWIDPAILITGNQVSADRKHTLNYTVSGSLVTIGIDAVNKSVITTDGLVSIYDAKAKEIKLLVDTSRLPGHSIAEAIEFIPIYTSDYISIFASYYGVPKLPSEPTETYRNRVLSFIRNGAVSLPAITEMVRQHAAFRGYEFKIYEHREHFKSWFVAGRSFAGCNYNGQRKYVKLYSDNIETIQVVTNLHQTPLQTIKAELSFLLTKFLPQGTRYEVA